MLHNPMEHTDSVSNLLCHFNIFCASSGADLMNIFTGNVMKQLVHAFSCGPSDQVMVHLESLESTQEARVTLSYCLKQLLGFFHALQTSSVHHNSMEQAKA